MDHYAVDAVAVRDEVERTTVAAPAVGTKRSYERDEKMPDGPWEKRRKCNFWEDAADDNAVDLSTMAAVGTKRSYERDEDMFHENFEKRYKCNYWEDPAYAWKLERWSSRMSQMAALDIDTERFLQKMAAWNAAP